MTTNPYAPPRAPLADPEPGKRGRPAMVWVISLFLGFGVVFGAISTIALLAGHPIGGEPTARAAAHLTVLDHLSALVMAALSAGAVVSLFRLKRSALPLFGGVFALGLASLLLNASFRPAYRAMFEGPGLYSAAAGWLINLAILAYVWRLRARGVLRA